MENRAVGINPAFPAADSVDSVHTDFIWMCAYYFLLARAAGGLPQALGKVSELSAENGVEGCVVTFNTSTGIKINTEALKTSKLWVKKRAGVEDAADEYFSKTDSLGNTRITLIEEDVYYLNIKKVADGVQQFSISDIIDMQYHIGKHAARRLFKCR